MLQKNDVAPDFTLYATPDQKIKLSEFKGIMWSLLFIRQTGVRYVAIRWHSIMKCSNILKNLMAARMILSRCCMEIDWSDRCKLVRN